MATFTIKELKEKHGDAPVKKVFTQEELKTRGQGTVAETFGDLKEGFLGIGEEFFKGGENIVDLALDEDLTFGEKARGIGAEAFRRSSRAFGEGVIA